MTTAQELTQKKCQPCEGIGKALESGKVKELLKALPEWKLRENGKGIYRDYLMKNFMAAVDLIHRVAQIAEAENHHPDIHLTAYRKLRIELSTHTLDGLSENDFIEAAKISELPAAPKT